MHNLRASILPEGIHPVKTELNLVDWGNHNPRVGGSNPSTATSKKPFDNGIFPVKGLSLCADQIFGNRPNGTDLASFGPQLCTVCAQHVYSFQIAVLALLFQRG